MLGQAFCPQAAAGSVPIPHPCLPGRCAVQIVVSRVVLGRKHRQRLETKIALTTNDVDVVMHSLYSPAELNYTQFQEIPRYAQKKIPEKPKSFWAHFIYLSTLRHRKFPALSLANRRLHPRRITRHNTSRCALLLRGSKPCRYRCLKLCTAGETKTSFVPHRSAAWPLREARCPYSTR